MFSILIISNQNASETHFLVGGICQFSFINGADEAVFSDLLP